jgi:hypothetical protein
MAVAQNVKEVHQYLDDNVRPTIEKIITPVVEARATKPKRAVLESLAEALGLPKPNVKTTRSEREANQLSPGGNQRDSIAPGHEPKARLSQRGTVYKR